MGARRAGSSPKPWRVDHERRWRPRTRGGGVCGYTFDDVTCGKKGPHYCQPRADRAVAFFRELLLHTAGPRKRTPFVLAWWQEHEIIRPLFGEVLWSVQWRCYVRRYSIAYLTMGRKNGKSAKVAGLMLLLLVGDDEEAAEVYGAARDTKQAAKIFQPAVRMAQLSPELALRLRHNKAARRLIDEHTASWFETITADAAAQLGHNPHAFYIDEVSEQRDGSLFVAMRTAAGARHQPLFVLLGTETDDPASFGAGIIDEAERIQENPRRAPHIFTFVRKAPRTDDELARLHRLFPGHPDLPVSTDPWDERNWAWPNPALDDFLDRKALRDEALEARNEPRKRNAFLRFRMNIRVSMLSRFIATDLWDTNVGPVRALNAGWLDERLAGQRCWAGLDLSSKLDLTAWSLLFEDGSVKWRFWIPEAVVPLLDEHTDNQFSQWVRSGWVTATDGDTIDYEAIYDAVADDNDRFVIVNATYDKWSGEPVRQAIVKRTGLQMYESDTTYGRMTAPLAELQRLLKAGELRHGGHPVARWCADNLQVKSPTDDPDRMRPVKPERHASGKRIDGATTLLLAIDGRLREQEPDIPPVPLVERMSTRGSMSELSTMGF